MTTARQMLPAIGARVYLQANSLLVACVVVDAKNAYGQARVQVEPVAGKGRTWVNLSSVKPIEEGQDTFGFVKETQVSELEDLWGVK